MGNTHVQLCIYDEMGNRGVMGATHIYIEGAEWSFHKSVSAAARYLGEQGVKLHDAQVSREAKRNGARDGWRFTTDLNTVAPP